MAKVLEWTASQLSSSFTQAALESLVPACHGTARHAVRLVEASIDTVLGDDAFDGRSVEKIDKDVVDATLVRLGYKFGLSAPEFDLLVRLSQAPGGKLGLSTLASVLDEESKTVEQVYEPYLLQKGFMTKTTNGRQITEAGLALVR
jgi:Holliday junction DNA helicase RuvB